MGQRGEYVQRGMNRYINKTSFNRIKFPEALLPVIMRLVIVLLCVYIAARCINLITNDKAGNVAGNVVSDTSRIIAKEIVENADLMTQYMLYVENHGSMTEGAKKELLNALVTDYLKHSEYTYDTSDPGYNQVINLIYENSNYKKEETTTKTEKETKVKTVAVHKVSNKIIVPMPKVNGKLYNANNIGSFNQIMDKFYIVTNATALRESDMPVKKAMSEKFKITGNNKKPQILIYHTHSQEEFSNSNKNTATTIIGVGDRLAKVLKEQFGYNVIHDTSKYDIVNGKLDRHEAYDQSRAGVKKILKKYPSVTEINNKKTAQVMFFNGMSRFKNTGDIDYLYNPYLYENLALALQMKANAESYYPGFSRRNYVNAYKYNLDLCKQSMLIEVGAQTNTYQEADNAAEPLARLIDIVMGKKK